MGGVSLMVIERGPGVKTTKMNCQGVLSSGTSYIEFDEVNVPVENLLGKEGKGFQLSEFFTARQELSACPRTRGRRSLHSSRPDSCSGSPGTC